MTNVEKKILTISSILLLVISFFLALYINVYQFISLKSNPFGSNFFDFFEVLIPFVLLISLYFINFVNNNTFVNNNIWYKIISIISFITIIFMLYRTIFDDSLILWYKTDYHINFDYFNNQIVPIKSILYGLSLTNILFIIEEYLKNKEIKN